MNHTKKKVFTLAGVLCVLAVCAGIIFTMVYKTTSNYTATYYADIDIEGYGVITVALDGESAPETVENFVTLAQSGFYDGLTFHRIIEGFMMQGGDPNGDGTGGSGTTVTGEFSANGIENNLSHTRGAVSMARSSDYDSASSQFFIVQQDSTYLDGNYAVFGYVISGMDIVDKICEEAEPIDDNGLISPEEQPVIQSIQIYE
ncbi:MAG: Peptidyl-prolyl cis-trans isomerase [Oscillospiraceae bacterium]